MAATHPVDTYNPLEYLSSEELSRLDETFEYALRDATCLVFWTGLPRELAQRWAEQHELQTLTIAMGPLFSDHSVGGARYGQSSTAWTQYMKGASCRFAQYACRGGRRAVVLTKPPPNLYSEREWSTYRNLEEPILKGVLGGPLPVQIDRIHPTIKAAAAFQYQIWPLDKSSEWYIFFSTLSSRKMIIRGQNYTSIKRKAIVRTVQISVGMTQIKHNEMADKQQGEIPKTKKNVQGAQPKARAKKEAKRKRAELEQQKARAKKEAKRKKAERCELGSPFPHLTAHNTPTMIRGNPKDSS